MSIKPDNIYDNCPSISCGMCKYFKVNADLDWVQSVCKRLDHKQIQFAIPCFKSYDCGQRNNSICNEFEPSDRCVWLKEHWTSIKQYEDDALECGVFPIVRKYVGLCVDKDQSTRYFVKAKDFCEGSFVNEDGTLKWIKRCFYKQTREGFGYKLVWEYRNGVVYDD